MADAIMDSRKETATNDAYREALDSLEDRIAALEAALEAAPADHQPDAAREPIQRASRRLLIPVDWPRAGGRDYQPTASEVFASTAFARAYRPSGETRAIYFAASEGLARLSRALHLPLYKAGVCGEAHVWRRMRQLRIDRYGAVRRQGDAYIAEQGWSNWFPSHLKARELPSRSSPVTIEERAIVVALPEGLEVEAFDRALDAELKHAAIDQWAMTQTGRDHCATVGVDPAAVQRLTRYPGGDGRLSPCTEICAISPSYSGPDRLIALAERIILRALGLID